MLAVAKGAAYQTSRDCCPGAVLALHHVATQSRLALSPRGALHFA